MIWDLSEALRFLTLFPFPGSEKKRDLARAMFFFPLVGFLIALLSLGIVQGLSGFLSERLQALTLVTIPILVTGGLHVDGFADFCDGFFTGKKREDIFRIMRDSRVGVWGSLGVVLLLFWKWEVLADLTEWGGAFLLALTAARWAQVVLSYFLPYANPEGGLGESVAGKVKIRALTGATLWLALLVFFLGRPGLICFISLLPFLASVGFLFRKRVGGVTGDLLGAASEATELFVLVFFLIWGEIR